MYIITILQPKITEIEKAEIKFEIQNIKIFKIGSKNTQIGKNTKNI